MPTQFKFEVGDLVKVFIYPGESNIYQLEHRVQKICRVGSLKMSLGRKKYLILVKWYTFPIKKTPEHYYFQDEIWLDEDRLELVNVNESLFMKNAYANPDIG